MKKQSYVKLAALVLLSGVCLFVYFTHHTSDQDPFLITDYSRLHPVKVERVIKGKEEEQLIALVKEAREKNLKISIAGGRHSQGGHTYYKDGIVIDMTPFHKILHLDSLTKTIRVQAGATWKDIQDYINPYGLAVKTMQSQNIFTVGGSISINAHGRDIRNGSLIKSVESFRILTADGQIKQVSRSENAELFPLALGGYGLFGIILDVTLSLTDDEVYRVSFNDSSVENYSEFFMSTVLANPDIRMHIARISVAPDSFLTHMYALNYSIDDEAELESFNTLALREQGVGISKLLFNLNRSSDWGKNVFWRLQHNYFSNQDEQQRISRNNSMRSESTFMEYRAAGRNDLLQEYFVPVEEFRGFMKSLRELLLEDRNLDLLNITVRYVNEDKEAVLSYAQQNMFALVFLFNMPLSDQGQARSKVSIERILELLISHKGTYYLPYAPFPTVDQFQRVYSGYAEFAAKKLQYDPEKRFMNYFYEQYIGETASK